MSGLDKAVADFLDQRRIAVAGVSRSGKEAANAVYRKLKGAGYEVYPVNPAADEVEGDACYPTISAVPAEVDAVFIATHPDVTGTVMRECADLGIRRVWVHRSFGQGSVSDEAVEYGRAQGLTVIPGGCPMMHVEPVDVGHKCMRWVLRVTGKLPRT
ncbi:MAG: CoA-binding protein [Gemmatimonadales bacterium]|jgi:predicted CoA-binding protein